MTNEATLPNSHQPTLELIAWVSEKTEDGPSSVTKEKIPIELLTDKEVRLQGILGIQKSGDGEFEDLAPMFIIMANEYYSVKQEILTILEASVVNSNQLKALKSMVEKAFNDKTKELFDRVRVTS